MLTHGSTMNVFKLESPSLVFRRSVARLNSGALNKSSYIPPEYAPGDYEFMDSSDPCLRQTWVP